MTRALFAVLRAVDLAVVAVGAFLFALLMAAPFAARIVKGRIDEIRRADFARLRRGRLGLNGPTVVGRDVYMTRAKPSPAQHERGAT